MSALPPDHMDSFPTDDDATDHGPQDHYLMGNSAQLILLKLKDYFLSECRDPGIIIDGTNKTKTQAAASPQNILKSAVCLKSTIKLLFLYFNYLNDWGQTILNLYNSVQDVFY